MLTNNHFDARLVVRVCFLRQNRTCRIQQSHPSGLPRKIQALPTALAVASNDTLEWHHRGVRRTQGQHHLQQWPLVLQPCHHTKVRNVGQDTANEKPTTYQERSKSDSILTRCVSYCWFESSWVSRITTWKYEMRQKWPSNANRGRNGSVEGIRLKMISDIWWCND